MLFGFCSSALYQNCCGIVYQFCLRDMYCSNLHHSVELQNLKTSTSTSHCLDFAHVHYTITIVELCIGFVYGICTVVTYTTAWGFKTQHWPLAPHWYTLFGFCSCALYHSCCGIVCRFCLRDMYCSNLTTVWSFKTLKQPLAPHWYTLFGYCLCALYQKC